MTKDIKLVAIDLDGTLLNTKHELTARTEKAIRAAMSKGVQVILATGKTYPSAKHLIEKLGLATPGIYVQGLIVYNPDGSVRHQQTLDPAIARRVITFAEDRGFTMMAYSGTRILVRAESATMKELVNFHEPMPEAVGPLQNILETTPINKLIVYGDAKRIKSLRWQLGMQLNGQANLMQAQIPTMLEVLPAGASKGRALKSLIRELGVSYDQTLAIGDAENDSEMLQIAGIGVAMGNADEKLKQVAALVVADNDHDGVAEALEKYIPGIVSQPEPAPVAETAKPQKVEEKSEEEKKE